MMGLEQGKVDGGGIGLLTELEEDTQRRPGIEGGVVDLRGAKLLGLPVAHAGGLAHALLEEDGVDLLQAELAYAVAEAELLQLDKGAGLEGAQTSQAAHIIRGAQADLEDLLIRKKVRQRYGEADEVEVEEVAVRRGKYPNLGTRIRIPYSDLQSS